MRVVVYDLVSENTRVVKSLGLEKQLRNLRIYCVRLLHGLGVQSTESVVIVSPNNYNRIDEVIDVVIEKYEEFYSQHGLNLPKPIVRQLELTTEQSIAFLEVAKNRLLTTIDEQIDKLVSIRDSLQINNVNENTKKLLKNIKRIKREWIKIKNTCIMLGIDIQAEIDYLIDVCNDLIRYLQAIGGI